MRRQLHIDLSPPRVVGEAVQINPQQPQPQPSPRSILFAAASPVTPATPVLATATNSAASSLTPAAVSHQPPPSPPTADDGLFPKSLLLAHVTGSGVAARRGVGSAAANGRVGGSNSIADASAAPLYSHFEPFSHGQAPGARRFRELPVALRPVFEDLMRARAEAAASSAATTAASSHHAIATPALPLKRAAVLKLAETGAVTLAADPDESRLEPAPKIVREIPTADDLRAQAREAVLARKREVAAAAKARAAAAEEAKRVRAAAKAARRSKGPTASSPAASPTRSRAGHSLQVPGRSTIATESAEVQALRAELDRQRKLNEDNEAALAAQLAHAGRSEAVRNAEDEAARLAALPKPPAPTSLPLVPFSAQGDLEMYSSLNMDRRLAIRLAPEFVALVQRFWMALETHETQQAKAAAMVAPRTAFIKMLMLIFTFLHADDAAAEGEAEEREGAVSNAPAAEKNVSADPLASDAPHSSDRLSALFAALAPDVSTPASRARTISFPEFHDALWELADTWTLTAELHEYLAFLEAVHKGITRQKTEAELAADARMMEQRMHGANGGGRAGPGSKPQTPSPIKTAALQGAFKLALEGSPLDSRTPSKSVSATPSRSDSPLPPIVYSSDDGSEDEAVALHKKRMAAQAAAIAKDPTLVARMAARASLLAPATPSRRPSLPTSETEAEEKEKSAAKPVSRLASMPLTAEPALAVSMPFSTVSRVALATKDQAARDASKMARLAAKMARQVSARDSTTSSTIGSSSTTNSGRSSQGLSSSSAGDEAQRVKSVEEAEDDADGSDDGTNGSHKRASQWGLSSGRAKASERDQPADNDTDEANRAWLAAEAAKRKEQLRRASASNSPVRSAAASRRPSITHPTDRSPSSARRGPRSPPAALGYGDLVPFDPLLISTHIGVGPDGELTGTMSPIRALVARPAGSRPRTSEGFTTAQRANPRMMWPASPSPLHAPAPSTAGAQAQPSPRKSPRSAHASQPASRLHVDAFKASGDSRSLSARQSALDELRARMVSEARAQELKRGLKDVVIKMGGVQAQVTEAMLREAKPTHARTASSMHAMAALTLQLQASSGLSGRAPRPPPAPLSAPAHAAPFSGSNTLAATQPLPPPRSAVPAGPMSFADEPESPPSPVLGPTLADSDPALTYSARWDRLRQEKRAARELALKQASLDDVGLCESVYRNRVYLAANHRSNQNAEVASEEEKQEGPNLAGQLREHAAPNGIIRMLLDTPRSLQARAARFPIYSSRPVSVARQRSDSQRVRPVEFDLTRTFYERMRDAKEIEQMKRESTTHAPTPTAAAYPSGSQTARPGTAPVNVPAHASRAIADSPPPPLRDISPEGQAVSLAATPPKHPWRPRPNSSLAMPSRVRQMEHVLGRQGISTPSDSSRARRELKEEDFRRAPFDPSSAALFVQAQRHKPEAHAWSLPRPSRPSSSPNGLAQMDGYAITHFPSPPASAHHWREHGEPEEDDLDVSDGNDPQAWESDQSDRASPEPVVPPSPRLVCVETNPGPCGGCDSNEPQLSNGQKCSCEPSASAPQLASAEAASSGPLHSDLLISGSSDDQSPAASAAPLPLSEVRRQVAAHFSSRVAYDKEVLETAHVLRFLRSDAPTQVLSLACGGAVGAETFAEHFPHAQSRLHGIDIKPNQTALFYASQGLLHFVEADLFADPPTQPALQEMRSCETWFAIHACRHLAHRVLQLFKEHAPIHARLLIVPCCLMRRTELTAKVGVKRWKEVKAMMQGRDQKQPTIVATMAGASSSDAPITAGSAASHDSSPYSSEPILTVPGLDYRTATSMFLRNELLASEFAEAFVGYVHMTSIPSQYNTGLYFVKQKQSDPPAPRLVCVETNPGPGCDTCLGYLPGEAPTPGGHECTCNRSALASVHAASEAASSMPAADSDLLLCGRCTLSLPRAAFSKHQRKQKKPGDRTCLACSSSPLQPDAQIFSVVSSMSASVCSPSLAFRPCAMCEELVQSVCPTCEIVPICRSQRCLKSDAYREHATICPLLVKATCVAKKCVEPRISAAGFCALHAPPDAPIDLSAAGYQCFQHAFEVGLAQDVPTLLHPSVLAGLSPAVRGRSQEFRVHGQTYTSVTAAITAAGSTAWRAALDSKILSSAFLSNLLLNTESRQLFDSEDAELGPALMELREAIRAKLIRDGRLSCLRCVPPRLYLCEAHLALHCIQAHSPSRFVCAACNREKGSDQYSAAQRSILLGRPRRCSDCESHQRLIVVPKLPADAPEGDCPFSQEQFRWNGFPSLMALGFVLPCLGPDHHPAAADVTIADPWRCGPCGYCSHCHLSIWDHRALNVQSRRAQIRDLLHLPSREVLSALVPRFSPSARLRFQNELDHFVIRHAFRSAFTAPERVHNSSRDGIVYACYTRADRALFVSSDLLALKFPVEVQGNVATEEEKRSSLKEAMLLCVLSFTLRVPHLAQIDSIVFDKERQLYGLAMLYVPPHVSFYELIQYQLDCRNKCMHDAATTMHIVTQLAMTLAAMHEAGVAHLDLHWGNVLLTLRHELFIIDLGRADLFVQDNGSSNERRYVECDRRQWRWLVERLYGHEHPDPTKEIDPDFGLEYPPCLTTMLVTNERDFDYLTMRQIVDQLAACQCDAHLRPFPTLAEECPDCAEVNIDPPPPRPRGSSSR